MRVSHGYDTLRETYVCRAHYEQGSSPTFGPYGQVLDTREGRPCVECAREALLEALADIQARVGDVVAPRLRAIVRDGDMVLRARIDLAEHLRRAGHLGAAEAAAALTPDAAAALLGALGASTRGRPWTGEAREVRVEVLLTDAEAEELDRRRGATDPKGRSAWIVEQLGLRGAAS